MYIFKKLLKTSELHLILIELIGLNLDLNITLQHNYNIHFFDNIYKSIKEHLGCAEGQHKLVNHQDDEAGGSNTCIIGGDKEVEKALVERLVCEDEVQDKIKEV